MIYRKTYNCQQWADTLIDPTLAFVKVHWVSRTGSVYIPIPEIDSQTVLRPLDVGHHYTMGWLRFTIPFNNNETISVVYER
jgi:hypothetical protein